jgi:hypothetical protein
VQSAKFYTQISIYDCSDIKYVFNLLLNKLSEETSLSDEGAKGIYNEHEMKQFSGITCRKVYNENKTN